jgi:peptidoglycan/LPS O-acetylase OafA/YrhL
MSVAVNTPQKQLRMTELDSLRGLAAMAVLIDHFMMLWLTGTQGSSAKEWLLSLPSAGGDAAVLLFFVLSGYVLSLPWVEGKPQPYLVFITRRIFRIYIPYLAALASAVAGAYWLHGVATSSDRFCSSWSEPVDWHLVRQHVQLLGNFDSDQFDGPIWSLVVEMRVSLIFPLLCLVVLRLRNAWPLAMALFLSVFQIVAWRISPALGQSMIFSTMSWSAFFVIGIYLARERTRIAEWFARLARPTRISFATANVLLFVGAGPAFYGIAAGLKHSSLDSIGSWFVSAGASGVIVLSLNSDSCKRILHWKPIHWLGKVSYSIYLMHVVVLLYCVHLFNGKISLIAILLLSLALTLVVSWCFYWFIELPSMNLGRRLSRMITTL